MLKRFIQYYKPHKGLFFVDMFFSFLMAGFDLIFPIFSRNVINEIIPDGRMDLLLRGSIIMGILFILRYISNYIVAYYLWYGGF